MFTYFVLLNLPIYNYLKVKKVRRENWKCLDSTKNLFNSTYSKGSYNILTKINYFFNCLHIF